MDNRSIILLRALQLFAARGYDGVAVQEIADAAGITKPTLYYYFGSKQGLLQTLVAEWGEPLLRLVSEAAAYQGDLSLNLERLAAALFDYAKAHQEFYRMQLAMYFAPRQSLANQAVRQLNERLHLALEELFRQAAAHHAKMRGRELALAATFLGTVNTYIGLALNGYIELRAGLAGNAVRQFMHGIYC
ncbi:TetR family transcriptional regulator [Hydrogenispora ethanolica]|jgi:TetR/AcrR family transcriptional regulator|uniref:TetR family transcriptional regulator n=1 Tax=Hydrogenispora ethanolica TaxID=1082276 RepID=A0A4R1RK34_HYDET|nr:TetR/AcrR family transcriptional regulator [Hydrogenispora ethanolica]TCL66535.1 TetR family transcriptional regulator [Hydrogenispora ethanolica]